MPWWSWVLIWTALVLILLAVLVLGGLYLWRKLKALMAKVSEAESALTPAMSQGKPLHAERSSELPVGWDALSAEPIVVRAGLREEKEARKDARRTRRIANLYATGRPRRFSDLDFEPSPEAE
ncbi:MAG: hypothetical protein ACTIJJ_02385 [Galactobacter sp.]|uniref:hypothetical protein n=1 Tax=Galactobacter sp. TaxID=2676125 RepID=UPI0025BBB55D|nr:hypothetical protein [Galactobacter sp.]